MLSSRSKPLALHCVTAALLLSLGATPRLAAEGAEGGVDLGLAGPRFATAGASAIFPRSDGSFVLQGGFSTFNGVRTGANARVLADGSLGPAVYNLPGVDPASVDGLVAAAPQDGLWLFTPDDYLRRLDANGVPQASIRPQQQWSGLLLGLAGAPDGKLYVGGIFTASTFLYDYHNLVRLLPDLTLDESLVSTYAPNGSVWHIFIQPDGKLLVAGDFDSLGGLTSAPGHYARLLPDGTPDPTFLLGSGPNTGSYPTPLFVDAQGRSYWTTRAVGFMTSFNGVARNLLVRLLPDGSVDLGFDAQMQPTRDAVLSVRQTADGKLLLAGFFRSIGGGQRTNVARLLDSGALDASFDAQVVGGGTAQALSPGPGSTWYLGGSFVTVGGLPRMALTRVQADGSPDLTFAPPSGAGDGGPGVRVVLPLPDGKFLVGGGFQESSPGVPTGSLRRLLADGTIDPSFAVGPATLDGGVSAIVRLPDGRLLIAGGFRSCEGQARSGVARLQADGTLDPSFDPGSGFDAAPTALQVLSDGSLVVAGRFRNFRGQPAPGLVRLTSDGQTFPGFAIGSGFAASATIGGLAVRADDRIVVAGTFTSFAGIARTRVVEILPTGALSTSALGTTAAIPTGTVGGLAIGGDGSTYVSRNGRVYRFNAGGTLDATYGGQLPGGSSAPSINALLLHPDGTLLAGSSGVHRFLANGNLDPNFTPPAALVRDYGYAPGTGAAGRIASLAFGPNQASILVAGHFQTLGGVARDGFARLLARPYEAWLGAYFSVAELGQPAVSGDNADPDGDGLANLLEYAFALDPRANSQAGLPTTALVTQSGSAALELTYTRLKLPRGVTYTIEASADLTTWMDASVTETSAVDQGTSERVTVRDSVPATPGVRRFLRVRVTRG